MSKASFRFYFRSNRRYRNFVTGRGVLWDRRISRICTSYVRQVLVYDANSEFPLQCNFPFPSDYFGDARPAIKP